MIFQTFPAKTTILGKTKDCLKYGTASALVERAHFGVSSSFSHEPVNLPTVKIDACRFSYQSYQCFTTHAVIIERKPANVRGCASSHKADHFYYEYIIENCTFTCQKTKMSPQTGFVFYLLLVSHTSVSL